MATLKITASGVHVLYASGVVHSGERAEKSYENYRETVESLESKLELLKPETGEECEQLTRAVFKDRGLGHILRQEGKPAAKSVEDRQRREQSAIQALDPNKKRMPVIGRSGRSEPSRSMTQPIGGDNPLILSVVRKYYPPRGYERADLLAVASEAYLAAQSTFSERFGVPWEAWARRVMHQGLTDFVRKAKSGKESPMDEALCLNAPIKKRSDNSEDGPMEYLDLLGDCDPEASAKEGFSLTSHAVLKHEEFTEFGDVCSELLSEFELEVLALHLIGWSGPDIALGINRSTKAVNNALNRIRKKLKPVFLEKPDLEWESSERAAA